MCFNLSYQNQERCDFLNTLITFFALNKERLNTIKGRENELFND